MEQGPLSHWGGSPAGHDLAIFFPSSVRSHARAFSALSTIRSEGILRLPQHLDWRRNLLRHDPALTYLKRAGFGLWRKPNSARADISRGSPYRQGRRCPDDPTSAG